MLKNLLAEKIAHRLTNQEMANIIGTSRLTYENKVRNDKFTVSECKAFMKYFNKTFEVLFATDND